MRPRLIGMVMVVVVAAGCGGGKSSSSEGTLLHSGNPIDTSGTDENVVPQETMDPITRTLDRKRDTMARCLEQAIDDASLPRGTKGKITLSFTIAPSGHPENVKVVTSAIASDEVNQCIAGHVGELVFPALTKPLEWSYTYGLEAS